MLRARLTPARRAALLWRAATAPLRSLPDFLIIGAQKGGTTTLYETLCRHPNVAKASRKEVHYFEGRDYRRGTMWYRAHFPTAIYRSFSGRRLTGEATPLMHHVRPPQRIAALMPHVKLIAHMVEVKSFEGPRGIPARRQQRGQRNDKKRREYLPN